MDRKTSKMMMGMASIMPFILSNRKNTFSDFLPKIKTIRTSKYKRHQGEQEKTRRRRQIANGQIPESQILHI
jgi:hypothetical protein